MGRSSNSRSESSDEGSISDHSSDEEQQPQRGRETRSPSPKESSRSSRPTAQKAESLHLSRFYREKFGSHSPEIYLNLRVSGIRSRLSDREVEGVFRDELYKMEPFEIKFSKDPNDHDRLVYLNFERDQCAKTVRRELIPRLQKHLGSEIKLDPAGVLRDQSGKYIPDRFNRAQMGIQQGDQQNRRRHNNSPPPRHHGHNNNYPNNHHQQNNYNNNNYNNNNNSNKNDRTKLNQDDSQASRALFVGNLNGDIRHTELMKTFDRYGKIENIEIKVVGEGAAAFAFVTFMSIDSAMDALKSQHGKSIRPDSKRCQIGYGRSQPSSRLWVGGLGDWTTKDMLMKEFDRYGVVEKIEYSRGDRQAYINFADKNSATDAFLAMKNFTLHKDHRITVDYATEKKQQHQDRRRQSRSPSEDAPARKKRKPRTPSSSSSSSGSGEDEDGESSADEITTYEQLNDQIACTWKGLMMLKKTEYPLRLHRVHGREHLLQDLLRDEDGSAIRLNINQRLARDVAFYDKLLEYDSNQLAFMIGVEGSHSFTPLIQYLNEKKAIGMTEVDQTHVYVVPHCSLATKIIKKFAPRVQLLRPDSNFLLVILKTSKR